MESLPEVIIYLLAAIIAVPISKRLGFGSVLGYLAAGIVIGPFAFRFVEDPEHIMHFAELGVVFLLFIIGLELQPSRLWVLRRMVFGLGASQVLLTAAVIAAAARACDAQARQRECRRHVRNPLMRHITLGRESCLPKPRAGHGLGALYPKYRPRLRVAPPRRLWTNAHPQDMHHGEHGEHGAVVRTAAP